MTAEVIIMNKTAIALAADSALTYREDQGDLTKQKIYQTANKLFMLSKVNPIGIMVYGSSEFNFTPWEVVIKIYRKSLGNQSFDKLSDYVEHFLDFLGNMFDEPDQHRLAVYRLHIFYYQNIRNVVEKKAQEENVDFNDQNYAELINSVIDQELSRIKNLPYLDGYDDEAAQNILANYNELFSTIINEVFKSLPIEKPAFENLLKCASLLFVKHMFPNNASGIVIAGYGDKEIFPAMVNLRIDCVFDSKVKYFTENKYSVGFDVPSVILPFAIENMVDTFLYGIDPKYDRFIKEFLFDLFNSYPEVLLNKIPLSEDVDKEALLHVLQEESQKQIKDFLKEAENHVIQNHINPIRSAVNVLPKDELASMAEMLINLTSVKRRVSLQDEIVGGAIDVAVISKSDGFVWIKRKHYFNPEYNHHFFTNYYNDCDQEPNDE